MMTSSCSWKLRCTAIILCSLCLTACGAEPSASGQKAAENPVDEQALNQNPVPSGREVYSEFCASCHDTCQQGAPVTGKPAEWEGRSQLWQAVLMEHAKAGYLDMPARGGALDLSDLSVSRAVEYMMLATFPDQLPD